MIAKHFHFNCIIQANWMGGQRLATFHIFNIEYCISHTCILYIVYCMSTHQTTTIVIVRITIRHNIDSTLSNFLFIHFIMALLTIASHWLSLMQWSLRSTINKRSLDWDQLLVKMSQIREVLVSVREEALVMCDGVQERGLHLLLFS